nr:MAG TPA: hypothetical protein [Caudoviricetes sp.]
MPHARRSKGVQDSDDVATTNMKICVILIDKYNYMCYYIVIRR